VKNLSLKFFAVAAALALSYYVNSETHLSVIGFSAPIEVSHVPEDKILVWPLTPKVQVTVRGPSYLVSQVATSNLTYKVEIPDGIGADYRVELQKGELKIPPSVEVLAIEPAQLDFSFDNKIQKEVPVVVPRYGNLPEDVKLVSMEVKPPTVAVVGPEGVLKKLVSIETEPVDFRSLRGDVSKKLGFRDPGSLMTVSPSSVELKVQISAVDLNRELQNIPVEVRGVSGISYVISPETVSVEIAGKSAIIDTVREEIIVPFVKVGPGTKKRDKLTVGLELPEGLRLKKITPAEVQISDIIAPPSKKR